MLISNAQEYAVVAQQHNPNIYIEFVSKSTIESMHLFLDMKWEGVKAVPQTHRMHCYYPISSSQLMVAETSDAAEFKVVSIFKSRTTSENHSSCLDSDSDSEEESESGLLEEAPGEAPEVNVAIGQWMVVNMMTLDIQEK